MPNLLKFLTAVFTVQLVAFAATAKTYYFIGTAGSGYEDRIYTSKQGESVGWAESATATTAIGHTTASIGVRYGAKDEQFGTVTGQGVTTAMAHCFKSDLARKCFGRISGTDLLWQGPGLMMLLQ